MNVALKKYGDREEVWNGLAEKTRGGLTKADLTVNKTGKIVSIKLAQRGKQLIKNMKENAIGIFKQITDEDRKAIHEQLAAEREAFIAKHPEQAACMAFQNTGTKEERGARRAFIDEVLLNNGYGRGASGAFNLDWEFDWEEHYQYFQKTGNVVKLE